MKRSCAAVYCPPTRPTLYNMGRRAGRTGVRWREGDFYTANSKRKNKYVSRQINDRVIGFSRGDKQDFVKAGANTMNHRVGIHI